MHAHVHISNCASGIGRNTTSASCRWWPPWVQVRCTNSWQVKYHCTSCSASRPTWVLHGRSRMQQSIAACTRAQSLTRPHPCAWKEIMCPYASCTDCCIVHSNGTCADPELLDCGAGGWNCMLLLHFALTCADTGPDLSPLRPDLWKLILHLLMWWFHTLQLAVVVLFRLAIGTNTSLAHVAGITHCNMRWWYCSFQPLVQILHFALGQLALCGGGLACTYT